MRLLHVQPYMVDTRDSPLFTGGMPMRLAWLRPLVPPLRAATLARRVVQAVEAPGRERLVIPWIFKWLPPDGEDGALFKVRHLDGDREDLEVHEVEAALDLYKKCKLSQEKVILVIGETGTGILDVYW